MIILRQKKTDEQLRATGHGESRLPNQEQTRTNRGKFQGKFFSIRSPLESRVVLWKDLSFAGGAELNVRSQFQRLKHRWFQWNGAGLAWNPPQLLILHRLLIPDQFSFCNNLLWTNARFTQLTNVFDIIYCFFLYFGKFVPMFFRLFVLLFGLFFHWLFSPKKSVVYLICGDLSQETRLFIFSMKIFNIPGNHILFQSLSNSHLQCNPVLNRGCCGGRKHSEHYQHCKFWIKPSLPHIFLSQRRQI